MKKIKKSIFLIRHGLTDYNEEKKMQGLIDVPLNNRGKEQAQAAAKELSEVESDLIVHSPLIRAAQTAEIIAGRQKRPKLRPLSSLVEMDIGDYEGKSFKSYEEEMPDYCLKWRYNKDIPLPGGESYQDVYLRVKDDILKLIQEDFKTLFIVAHSAVNRALLSHILNIDVQQGRSFTQENCSLSKITLIMQEDKIYPILNFWNQYLHLEGLI